MPPNVQVTKTDNTPDVCFHGNNVIYLSPDSPVGMSHDHPTSTCVMSCDPVQSVSVWRWVWLMWWVVLLTGQWTR